MNRTEEFSKHITEGDTSKGDFITLGGAILDGEPIPNVHVNIPLKTLNRHGLIPNATYTKPERLLLVYEK
jgi:hypothetical protein